MGPELDLCPQLERLDRLICWSEDIDEEALSFAFRPLWQLDEPARAALALSRAQATEVYAGLKLWPDAVVARLAEAQLVADGTYPNAAAVFAEQGSGMVTDAREVGEIPRASGQFWAEGDEPRDRYGRWTIIGEEVPSPGPPIRVATSRIDPFADGNPDINQKIDGEEKQQEHGSAIAPHPDPNSPGDMIRTALNPLGNVGAGGRVQTSPAAGVATKSNVPLANIGQAALLGSAVTASPLAEADPDLSGLVVRPKRMIHPFGQVGPPACRRCTDSHQTNGEPSVWFGARAPL